MFVLSSTPRPTSIASGTDKVTVADAFSSLVVVGLATVTASVREKASDSIALRPDTFPTEAPTGVTASGGFCEGGLAAAPALGVGAGQPNRAFADVPTTSAARSRAP